MIEKALARFYLFLNGYYPIQIDSPLTLFTGVVLVLGCLLIVLRGLHYIIGAESAQATSVMYVPMPTVQPARQSSQLLSGCVVTFLIVVLGLVALGAVALYAMINS